MSFRLVSLYSQLDHIIDGNRERLGPIKTVFENVLGEKERNWFSICAPVFRETFSKRVYTHKGPWRLVTLHATVPSRDLLKVSLLVMRFPYRNKKRD